MAVEAKLKVPKPVADGTEQAEQPMSIAHAPSRLPRPLASKRDR